MSEVKQDDSGRSDDERRPVDAGLGETQPVPVTGASLVGSRLAGYLILSRLGRGGMADVYAARDIDLDRDVAIKVLRPDLARDRDYITRFRREAKAAAKLNHSNIVQIYEVGEDHSRHYIAQELVTGQNLREYVETHGAVDPKLAVEVLYGVACALDAAAIEGITHRDIKPENVMLSKAGGVKVADFGLARLGGDADGSRGDLTQAGLTLGTPRYMSPEQVQGLPVDPRSDLYSLGVMMYHLLAGRPPFQADDPLALAFAHVNETPEPIDHVRGDHDVPEWLIGIVFKLLRKHPDQRFQSAAELLDALTGDDSGGGGKTRRLVGAASATARLQRIADEEKLNRRWRRLKAVALSLVPLLVAGVGVAVASQVQRETVTDLLQPDAVVRKDTVEEQFLEAFRLDNAWGWKAVAEYFPPRENAVNQAYAAKASIQLARYFLKVERPAAADAVLGELLNNPDIDRKYRLVAWGLRVLAAQQLGDPRRIADYKRQMNNLYTDLNASNPEAVRLFDSLFADQQAAMGLAFPKET